MKKRTIFFVIAGIVFAVIATNVVFGVVNPPINLKYTQMVNEKIERVWGYSFRTKAREAGEKIEKRYGVLALPVAKRMTVPIIHRPFISFDCFYSGEKPDVLAFYGYSGNRIKTNAMMKYYFSKICELKAKEILADNSLFQ